MDQERKNLQSTKPPPPTVPPDEGPVVRTNLHICAIVSATDKIYTDLTGKFPIQSTLGNKDILVTYCVDSNSILAEPLKNRTANKIAQAHQTVYKYLSDRGLKPKFEVLDNECLAELI